MKNEMMETNQTGFLALQDFDLADVMCAEMDGLSAAFERVKICLLYTSDAADE